MNKGIKFFFMCSTDWDYAEEQKFPPKIYRTLEELENNSKCLEDYCKPVMIRAELDEDFPNPVRNFK